VEGGRVAGWGGLLAHCWVLREHASPWLPWFVLSLVGGAGWGVGGCGLSRVGAGRLGCHTACHAGVLLPLCCCGGVGVVWWGLVAVVGLVLFVV
jgi:hypothetical protein